MLLDRIEIDSCGSLERIQLGPFSHRLNAVYGPRGAGKTATLEFIRGVMLGTDREWHRGSTGSVVWADHEGLLHCRRERDGTPAGRLSIDYVARNGRMHDHHYGNRDLRNYDRLHRMTELPRQTIDSLVAATRQTPLSAILDACRAAGLDTFPTVHNAAAIARLRETIATLERRLDEGRLDAPESRHLGSLHGYQATRSELDATRLRLLDELTELDRLERTPVRNDPRREELTARLLEAHDEVARLSHQESELRHRLSEVQRDLAHTGEFPKFESSALENVRLENSHWRIAVAHRRELEELDSQLMHWRRTLREVCAIRSSLNELSEKSRPGAVAGDAPAVQRPGLQKPRMQDTHYHNFHFQGARRQETPMPRSAEPRSAEPRSAEPRSAEPRGRESQPQDGENEPGGSRSVEVRLQSVSRQIELLVQRYDSPTALGPTAVGPTAVGPTAMGPTTERLLEELRTSGSRLGDPHVTPTHDAQNQQLRLCQELLVRFIDQLIDARNLFLRRIASEYEVPLAQLIEAFGDWHQCHDHPHLYQWLLSDKCPPRIDDVAVHAVRRKRLERDQAELLEQLGRAANRLDDRGNEIHLLQIRLRETPAVQPSLVDPRRRDACHAELARVEERLRWLDSRVTLEEERERHQRRLKELLRDSTRPAPLMSAASRWLSQLGSQPGVRLWTEGDGSLRVDGNSLARLDETARQTVAIALRMAAAEELSQRGHQVPLLIDDLPSGRHLVDAPERLAPASLAAALARYSEGGRQLIVFTEDRPLADAIRNFGGRVQSLATPQYIQMRYRDESPNRVPRDPLSSVNRDLDMMWREANGLYDDPYWYQNPHRSDSGERRRSVETVGRIDSAGPSGSAGRGLPTGSEEDPAERASRGPASPFFLTGNSPVDQAPSIDAVAADRLAQIGIVRVGQLLAADPRSLAGSLGLAEVTPRVVRRWQGEAQLVCTVPQLRNFDARVLVGCGFTDPKELAQMHPGQLLETVEAFLATDQGRRILQSGTSYELTRITSWIAAANRSVARGLRHGDRGPRKERTRNGSADGRSRDEGPKPRPSVLAMRSDAGDEGRTDDTDLRFYLDRQSPVVDAPSIGPKAAARLNRLGIETVDDLLSSNPADLAKRLGNRRVDEDRVRQWQQQAKLVCRIPRLRGHDAAILVAMDIFEPEELAEYDAGQLFDQIDDFIVSPAGRRILRGGKQPDRAEIAGWIRAAQRCRSLRAA